MGVAPYLCLLLSCLAGVRSDVVLTQPKSAVVKPGQSHTLTCAVRGFSLSSYHMHWVKQVPGKGLEWLAVISSGGSKYYAPGVQSRFTISKDSSTVNLQMTSLRLDDTATYYCARGYYYGWHSTGHCDYLDYWGGGTSLTVTSEVKSTPSVYIIPSCNRESDQGIRLLCLVKDYQPESISQTWSTNSGDVTTGIKKYPAVLGQNSKYTMSSLLEVSAADWKKNKVYYCKAGYKPNEIETAEWRKPQPQPPKLSSLVPSREVIHSQANAVLGCVISGFSPDNVQVSWKKAGSAQEGIVLPSTRRSDGTFETISYLTVPVQEWTKKQKYTCEVNHAPSRFSGQVNMTYQEELSVFIQNPDIEEMWIDKTATVKCTVICADPEDIDISWQVGGKEKTTGIVEQQPQAEGSQYRVLSELQISVEEWFSGVEYECSAQGSPSSSRVSARTNSTKVEIKSPKVRLLPPPQEETKKRKMATLECVVSGFYPDQINVIWEKHNTVITSNTSATPTALEQGWTFSTRHFLTLSLEEWKTESVFSCTVIHRPSNTRIKKQVKNVQELSVFIQNPDIEEIWIDKTATVKCTVLCADPEDIHISWHVGGKEKTTGIVEQQPQADGSRYRVLSELQISVEEWFSGVEYECSAQGSPSSSRVSARTNSTKVEIKSPKVRVLPPPQEETKKRKTATLECVVSGFYPDQINVIWEKDNTVITSNTSATPTTLEQGWTFSARHFLTVSLQEWKTESVFSCTVIHRPSNTRIKKQVKNDQELSVFIQNPVIEELWIDKTATVKCTVLCTDPEYIHISWHVGGKEKTTGIVEQQPQADGSRYRVLSELQISVEEWFSGVEYECSAQGSPSSSRVSARTNSTKVEIKSPQLRLLLPSQEETKKRKTATLECVVSGFYPDQINVIWEKDSTVITSNTRATPTTLEQGWTFSARHFLTVSLQEWKTESVFSCTVIHPPSNTRIKKQVKNVQELSVFIQNPDIEEIWIDKTATVKCTVLCTDPEDIHISWHVGGKEKTTGIVEQQPQADGSRYRVLSELQISVEEWFSGVEYECSAQGSPSSSRVSARTNSTKVEIKSPKVRLLPPSQEETKNKKTATLECVVSGFYPDQINVIWEKHNTVITFNTTATPTALEQGWTFSARHFLTVSLQEWKTESVFSCTVIHRPSNTRIKKQVKNVQELSVFIQNPDIEEMWIDKTATVKCTVLCTDPEDIHISWHVGGKEKTKGIHTHQAERDGSRYRVLSELQISVEEWFSGVEYECSAQGSPSSSRVSAWTNSTKVEIKSPKVRLLPPPQEETKKRKTATLECVVSGFYPDQINVIWEKGSTVIISNTTATPITLEQGWTFSARHFLTVSLQEWKTESVFSCTVIHPPSNTRIKKQVKNVQELSVFIQNPDIEEMWIDKTATVKCTVLCTDPEDIDISWQVGGKEKTTGIVEQQPQAEGSQYRVLSELQISVEEWFSGVEYECSAQGSPSSSRVSARTNSTKVEIKSPKVRLLPPPQEETKKRKMATLECVVSGFYPDQINVIWEKDSTVINTNTSATPTSLEQGWTFSTRHFLTVSLQEWKAESVFSCTVIHRPSNTRIKKQVKNVQELSVFIQNPDIEEMWIDKTATVKCTVLCADPEDIHISWHVGGKEKTTGIVEQQPQADGSRYRVLSELQISVEEWFSGVEYECSAQGSPSSSRVSARTNSTKVEIKSPKVRLLPPSQEETKNKKTATLECVVSGFYPNQINVIWEKHNTVITFNTTATPTALEQGWTFSARHFLTVSLQEWKTESVFSCTVIHPPSNTRIKKQVKNVQELSVFIQNPDIEEMWIDKTATMKCTVLCTDPEDIHISWHVGRKEKTKGIHTHQAERDGSRYRVLSELQISVEEWFSGIEYKCSAQGSPSSSRVSARTNSTKVEIKSPKVRLLPPPQEETKKRKTATLECVVSGFYPDQINVIWEKGSTVIISNTTATPTTLEQGWTFSARHFLTVSLQEWKTESVFSCTVIHPPSNTRIKKQVKNVQDDCSDTHPSVTLSKPSFEEIWTKRTATILCEVVHSDLLGFSVTWQVDGRKKEDGVRTLGPDSNGGEDKITSRLTVPAADWNNGAEYSCVIEDKSLPTPVKKSIRKNTGGVVTRPQVYLLPPSSDEVDTDQTGTLMCLVTKFSPADIYVAWMANDTLLKTGFVNQPVTTDPRKGWNTMTSQLKVSPEEWKSGTTFSCVVGHESLTTNLFRSINKSHSKPTLVNVSLVLTDSFKSCV
ncbi:LOW QUALITY PROTEIN: uncharacterized protein LOC132381361 [Hypanus sabinus]|uniref:LOW QUALITY PROTEIN: uncharacterized protein LOC132381361 n=1 Tax=Hypanus sabinus TaxID=79690 RepID=UPI0028C50C7F|nr:LOW QUALITY PROTEIN: uncharacterized protein LOC132381361 [Hypanus sabinus]